MILNPGYMCVENLLFGKKENQLSVFNIGVMFFNYLEHWPLI